MILAVVKGNVVSTNKTEKLHGSKLLIVEEWNIDTGKPTGQPKVALDIVGAGEGELVLCVSGSSARQTEQTNERPVDMAIIGIVDQAEMNGSTKYKKFDTSFNKPEAEEKVPEAEAQASAVKSEPIPITAAKTAKVKSTKAATPKKEAQ